MAKSSKKSTTSKPEEPKARAVKSSAPGSATASENKAPAKKPAAKPAPPSRASTPGAPLIDTSLAAESAAKLLAAGVNLKTLKSGAPAPAGATKQESALFRNIKAGASKPHSATMNTLLDKTHGPGAQPKNQPFSKQVGHNQTFGPDVTRTGVPRRTSG
jgi:hypothetical protein